MSRLGLVVVSLALVIGVLLIQTKPEAKPENRVTNNPSLFPGQVRSWCSGECGYNRFDWSGPVNEVVFKTGELVEFNIPPDFSATQPRTLLTVVLTMDDGSMIISRLVGGNQLHAGGVKSAKFNLIHADEFIPAPPKGGSKA